jgi:hypothetical protein
LAAGWLEGITMNCRNAIKLLFLGDGILLGFII